MITCNGTIKASDINTELGRGPASVFHLDGSGERSLAGKPYGLIKFSDFYCKSKSFNLSIGADGFPAMGLQLYGYGVTSVAGWDYGLIDGNRPSALFPQGYGGATSAFYPLAVGVMYGNRTGYQIVFWCGSSPVVKSYIYPFGERAETTWEFPNGAKYTYILSKTVNGYGSQDGAILMNELSAHVGQVCKVSIKAI